jgi:drug/metabolite transporter (DMT)-like permease
LTTIKQDMPVLPPRLTLSPMMSAYILLSISMLALSFAAVLSRMSQVNGIPSPLVISGRLLTAGLVLTPIVLIYHRDDLKRITKPELAWSIFAGIWLGVHFMFIVISLEHTSILISQVVSNTGPLWVALLETVFLKTKLSSAHYIAIVMTILGGLLIALSSTLNIAPDSAGLLVEVSQLETILSGNIESNALLGVILAVFAAIFGSIYAIIGRKVRANVPTTPYIWIVFTTGGMVGLVWLIVTGTPVFGHPQAGYLALLLLILVPQLIGHSLYNHILKFFPATLASIYGQSVTVGAGIIAFLLFAEVPSLLELVGSFVIMAGVMMAIITPAQKSPPTQDITTQTSING